MAREVKVYPPQRKQKKILVTLPEDIVEMIDDCTRAMGMTSRSAFLQVYFDTYSEQVITFTTGWLSGISYYSDKVAAEKRIKEAAKIAEDLGTKVTTRRT